MIQCVAPGWIATLRSRVLIERPVVFELVRQRLWKEYSLCYSSAFYF